MSRKPRRWLVGLPSGLPPHHDDAGLEGVVALTAEEVAEARRTGRLVLPFHELADSAPPALWAPTDVYLPEYRGKRLALLLSWLVASRLSGPGERTVWHLNRRQGPATLRRLLIERGWRLTASRRGREVLLSGEAPAEAGAPPEPGTFQVDVGSQRVLFAADYGVFSPGQIDAGTQLLLDVAMRGPTTEVVADIGVGYGPLAISLVLNGIAKRAVATDVDSVALWLALRNASISGVPLAVACDPSPDSVEPTSLTVCNVPTHVDMYSSAALMAGLARRASAGRLLAVVHASLEKRYARHFTEAGLAADRHRGPLHVVFEIVGPQRG